MRVQGRGEGERAGRSWVSELERAEGADHAELRERESAARSALESRVRAWGRLPDREVDHDRAWSAWRQALSDGSLVRFCLDQALSLPEDPSRALSGLSAVSPRRLGEVVASGVRAGFDAALRNAQSEAQDRVSARARAELTRALSARLDLGEGVARMQRAGHAVGFEEGFSSAVSGLSSGELGWRDEDRRVVDQALRAELRADLVAYEEASEVAGGSQEDDLGWVWGYVLLFLFIGAFISIFSGNIMYAILFIAIFILIVRYIN